MNHLDEFFATFEATDNFHFAPLMAKKAKAMTFRLMDDALQSGDWDDVVKYGEYLLSLYPEMHKPTSVLYNVGLAYEKLLEVEASAKYYLRFLIRAPRSDVRLAGVREKLLKWKSGVARSLQEAIVGGCYEWECEPWDSSCACYVTGWRPCVGEHFAEMKNCFGDCKKKCAMDDKYEEDCYVDDCGFDNCEQSRYACNDPNTPPLTTWTMVCIGIWNPTMKWWDCICDRDYLTLVSCVNPNDEWCLCEAWLD